MLSVLVSGTAMLAAGAGWVSSFPTAYPVNGWLIALFAAVGAFGYSAYRYDRNA